MQESTTVLPAESFCCRIDAHELQGECNGVSAAVSGPTRSAAATGRSLLACGDPGMDRRKAEGMHEFVKTGLKPLRRQPACLQHARNKSGIRTWGWKPQAVTLRAFSTRGSFAVNQWSGSHLVLGEVAPLGLGRGSVRVSPLGRSQVLHGERVHEAVHQYPKEPSEPQIWDARYRRMRLMSFQLTEPSSNPTLPPLAPRSTGRWS